MGQIPISNYSLIKKLLNTNICGKPAESSETLLLIGVSVKIRVKKKITWSEARFHN